MKKKINKNIVTLDRLESVDYPIDQLTPNTYNPNRQSDREFELLCRSIEEDGFTQPILAHSETKEIIDGEHRWRACKVLGWTTVPVVFSNMTKEQQMVATLRHNRARGSEDISKAADVLRSIQRLDALEHATDSLLLDDVEMRIMLENIPQAELTLRQEGQHLTVDEVNEIIKQENAFLAEKDNADTLTGKKEKTGTFTYILRYYGYEKKQILTALDEIEGETQADKIINLVTLYLNDEKAMAYIETNDDSAWQGRE